MFKYFIFTIAICSCLRVSFGQDFGKHQWKHRLVVLLTEDLKSDVFHKQFTELRSDEKGLLDRKIKIYLATPTSFRIDEENSDWKLSTEFYKKYRKGNNQTEIILIGLDGTIKLRQNTFLSKKELFSTIDVMPMRVNELRSKKQY